MAALSLLLAIGDVGGGYVDASPIVICLFGGVFVFA